MTALAATGGGLADQMLGEPTLCWHPVARYGSVMQRVEERLYADRRANGIAFTAVGAGLGISVGIVLRRTFGPTFATVVATCVSAAGKMLDDEANTMAALLNVGNLPAARAEQNCVQPEGHRTGQPVPGPTAASPGWDRANPSWVDATDRAWPEHGGAGFAPEALNEFGAAWRVDQHRLGLVAGEMLIAPSDKGDEHRGERHTSGGEPVLEPCRVLLVGLPGHQSGTDQFAQTAGQNRSGYAQIGAELVEAADAPECCTQDQDRPAIADESERPLDRGHLARPIRRGAVDGPGRRDMLIRDAHHLILPGRAV